MLNGLKQFWNLHDSTFMIFFHHSEEKWFRKYLCYWSLKSQESLLTHWLCRCLFNYLKNGKLFLSFFFHLWNLHQILNIILKKKIVTANVFLKLQTVKDLVRRLSKKRSFRTSFQTQHFKGSQTLVKSAWAHLYFIFSSFWSEMIWEISPLLKFQFIAVFFNTLTADYKYPVPDCKNLQLAIQMELP